MATIFRQPVANRIERRRSFSLDHAPNLLISTLVISTIARTSVTLPVERLEAPQQSQSSALQALLSESPTPHRLHEWPNPIHRLPEYAVDPVGTLYTTTLPPADHGGGARPGTVAPFDVKKQLGRYQEGSFASPLGLLSVEVVVPFQQADWPLAIKRPEPEQKGSFEVPYALLNIEQVVPFALYDWPAVPRRFSTYELVTKSFTPQLESQEVLPVAQVHEWPQPPDRRETLEAHALHTVIYEPSLPDPFGHRDWPTAVRKRGVDLSYAANISPSLLAEVVVLPFAQTEWPLVRKVARFQETPQPNLRDTLFVVPQQPFRQSDWPGAQRLVGRFDYNITNLLGTLPPPPIPFALDDWPNPLRKRAPHFDQWGQSLQHTTLFVENVKPFHQDDWNVGFLFDARPTYPFISYQPKVIIEGGGLLGLQPPTYVVGVMTVSFGIASPMSARGRSVDGEMSVTFAVDGSIETTEEFEGPV